MHGDLGCQRDGGSFGQTGTTSWASFMMKSLEEEAVSWDLTVGEMVSSGTRMCLAAFGLG
jgi:hypothetical protein